MEKAVKKNEGFDIAIVVTSNNNLSYWQWRLGKTRDKILSPKTKLIIVGEDWEGGAGQLLGTLYGIKKASREVDIEKTLKEGKTVAIYHTAGYGKRMAPLCGAEGNNKPGIKLPWPTEFEGKKTFFTVLEGVLFSTQLFANSRQGRVCVFWADQIIIPSRSFRRETKLPVEIFGIKTPFFLSPGEWRRSWQRYGILIKRKGLGLVQREKLNWAQFKKLIERLKLKPDLKGNLLLAKSLGCFSIDFSFLTFLLREFSRELELKKRKLETDFHLWTPLTTLKKEYLDFGGSLIYWQRIRSLKIKFQKETGKKLLLGEKNLGKETLWWDYGGLASYHRNILVLTFKTEEGEAAREFFQMEDHFVPSKKDQSLKIQNSIILDSQIQRGKIKNSVILNSFIKIANLKRAVIIKSKIGGLRSANFLVYYIDEARRIKAKDNEVITDIVIEGGTRIRMRSNLLRDGKKDWKIRLPQNPFSFREMERCMARLANNAFKIRL